MDDKYFMNEALKEAKKAYVKGEVPVGSIIVLNGIIIARGHNLRETKKDVTKHAELIAIKKASKKTKDWRLENSVLYVTLLPCPMCASAISQSRIKKVVFGTSTLDLKTKKIVLDIFNANNLSPKVEITEGVLSDDCKNLLKEFFKDKR